MQRLGTAVGTIAVLEGSDFSRVKIGKISSWKKKKILLVMGEHVSKS